MLEFIRCVDGTAPRHLGRESLRVRSGHAPEDALEATASNLDWLEGKVVDPGRCVDGWLVAGAVVEPADFAQARPGFRSVVIDAAGVVPRGVYSLRLGDLVVVDGVVALRVADRVVADGSQGPSARVEAVQFEVPVEVLEAVQACRGLGELRAVESDRPWTSDMGVGDCSQLGRPRAGWETLSLLASGVRPQQRVSVIVGSHTVVEGVRVLSVDGRLVAGEGVPLTVGPSQVLLEVPANTDTALASCSTSLPRVVAPTALLAPDDATAVPCAPKAVAPRRQVMDI